MDTKNTNIIYGLVGLVLGFGLTFLIMNGGEKTPNFHQMPDGSLMSSEGMDMRSMMIEMNNNLATLEGEAFDKAFLSEMIIHHEGAVDMARVVLEKSKRPELLNLANEIITAQDREIKMMQDWQNTWFK